MRAEGEEITVEAPPKSDAPRPRRDWRRLLLRVGIVLLTIGLLGLGGTLGWLLRGWLPSGGVGETTVVVKRPFVVEQEAVARGALPNVLGLGLDEARQAYADAGVDPLAIVARQVPYVAQSGSVVEQQPLAATRVGDGLGKVSLLVATKATMPDLVGLDGDAARERLADMGVGTTTLVRYDASVDPGAVSRTSPPSGVPARARATLVVSEAPSSVALPDVEATESDCFTEDTDIAGTLVAGAFVCDIFDRAVARYPINDRVTGFATTLALADGAPPGAAVRLVVRVDGTAVGTFTTDGTAVPVDVALDGGAQLTLGLTRVDDPDEDARVVLKDARIVGTRSGIDALVSDTP